MIRRTLSNGALLQISEQRTIPAAIVHVLLDAGAGRDPVGVEGLANLTADLITEGTLTRSAQEISESIDFIGASLSSSATADYAWVRLTTLRKHLDPGLDLLADVLLHPSFPDEEVERRREAILAGIKADEDVPGAVAEKAFRRKLFADGPYGHPTEGWPGSVERLTRDEVLDFYRRWYGPQHAVITVVGDVNADDMAAALEERLHDWKAAAREAVKPPTPRPAKAATVVIDKPLSQANIVLGHLGVARRNPDFYALTVMNHILGGGSFSSRLFDEIRTKAGLAYSVSSSFTSSLQPGSFQIVLQTKNASAKEAIEKAKQEVERIRSEPVSTQELKEAKQYLTGSFPLRLDSNSEIAGFLSLVQLYGLGDDYADRYAERINSVSAHDVQRVAHRYLHPGDLVLVVVADASEIGISSGP